MLLRNFVVALLLASFASACGNTPVPSISGPSDPPPSTPPPAAPVMAPPPSGVSPEVWRVAFLSGVALYRPESPAIVSFDVSGLEAVDQATFVNMAKVAEDSVEGRTKFEVGTQSGANFIVSMVSSLVCFGQAALGCTVFRTDSSGRVLGGKIEFDSTRMTVIPFTLVLHEIYRTLGISELSPAYGILSAHIWPNPRPSDEERLMLLGRYQFPLLAQYSVQ